MRDEYQQSIRLIDMEWISIFDQLERFLTHMHIGTKIISKAFIHRHAKLLSIDWRILMSKMHF